MKVIFLLAALPAFSAPPSQPKLIRNPRPVDCSRSFEPSVSTHELLEKKISRTHARALTAVKESKKEILEGAAMIRAVYAKACAALDLDEGKIAASQLESLSLGALAKKDRAECIKMLENLRDNAAEKGKKLVSDRMIAIHQPFHRASAELSRKYGVALKALYDLEVHMRETANLKPAHNVTATDLKSLQIELETALGDFSAHDSNQGKRTALRPGSRFANFDEAMKPEYQKAENANIRLSSLEEAYDDLAKNCGNFGTIKP